MKKLIKIDEKHLEKLQAAIDEAQGMAKVRRIDAEDMIAFCNRVFAFVGITKKALNGCKLKADIHAQSFPNSYRYAPESTQFNAEYRNGCWYLLDVYRGRMDRTYRVAFLSLTEEAKEAIIQSKSVMYDS